MTPAPPQAQGVAPSALEQSFRDTARKHNLTNLSIGVRNLGPEYGGHEWIAAAHWEGFTRTGHNCTSGYGDTLGEAISSLLRLVAADRFGDTILADEALPGLETV
jgi:hypothetical protein